MKDRFAGFGEWWRLFDALCIEHGHMDNSGLASEYCALTGKKADGSYETALKNLNNWRQGLHTPSRRNFRLLTLLLRVEDIAEVMPHWTRLYEEAQRRKPATVAENGVDNGSTDFSAGAAPPDPGAAGRPTRHWQIVGIVALVLVIAGASIIGLGGSQESRTEATVRKKPEPGPMIIDMTGQRVHWRELSEVTVGESVVIHGKRGRCGEQPPSWEDTFEYLPELATGIWSDGGVGYRISRSCGGATPTRAVVFTATRPGEDRFMLYEDPITIRVTE